MKTRYPTATIVSVCAGIAAFAFGGAASAATSHTIEVSDNVMLLDLSPARIDTVAHLREVLASLRSAKVVRTVKADLKFAFADTRSRG